MSLDLNTLPLAFWVALAALVGAMLGSFSGVVVYRLPRMVLEDSDMNLAWPGSHCPSCAHALHWWHNLPVISYALLRGRCGFCQAPIGRVNLFMELAFASLWAGFVAALGPSLQALVWAGFFSVLLVLLVIDWQTMLLPDALTLPLMWAGLLLATVGATQLSLGLAVWGAAGGYAVLWLVAEVFKRARGVDGMGGGDLKLMAALGAWLGAWALLPLVLFSSLLHVLLALAMGRRDQPVPFGPALVAAAVLVWASREQAWMRVLMGL
jgi:leader peptidase (prepilin peptidase)/N-methyltransferase